jgi:hypothetical protein
MIRALLFLLCAMTAWGQSTQERGRKIVDEALAALGGDRFLAMQDRVETGRAFSFFREEVSGLSVATIYTKYVTSEDGSLGVRERQSFGKMEKETSAVLFTGGKGYEITYRGARPIPDDTLERYRLTTLHNIFYILRVRLKEPGLVFESRGLDVWLNQPVEIVDITDADNQVTKVYFHQSTKYPIHQVFYRRDPKTKDRIEEVTDFGKFRDAGGGVYWPFTTQRTRDGEKIYEIYCDTVTVNQRLSDSLFVLPSDIKVLKKM